MWFRWAVFTAGLIVMSFGISLMIRAELGSAPWDVLHVGLFMQIGLTVGTWTIIMGGVLLAVAALITREWPKAGAYVNMLLVGMFVDAFLFLIPVPELMLMQILFLIIGIGVMGFGIGIYISPRMGAGPRDSVMLAIAERTPLSVARVRLYMEGSVLLTGWLIGGPVFIGTIIFSLAIGHITGWSLSICDKWMNNRMEERGMRFENIN